MGSASILITEHRFVPHLRHHARFGRFNVGLLIYRNNEAAREALEWWRDRCLEWCHDVPLDGKYADQGYLDRWPERYGKEVHIALRKGINLAPWNWLQYRYTFKLRRVFVEDDPLVLFHFARFRPIRGTWLFNSGQLEHGVMFWRLRQLIYGTYCAALLRARETIQKISPDCEFNYQSQRSGHAFWRALIPRILFGSDWIRIGPILISGRGGLGRWSGPLLSRTKPRLRHSDQ